jgi:hypothetical protein
MAFLPDNVCQRWITTSTYLGSSSMRAGRKVTKPFARQWVSRTRFESSPSQTR